MLRPILLTLAVMLLLSPQGEAQEVAQNKKPTPPWNEGFLPRGNTPPFPDGGGPGFGGQVPFPGQSLPPMPNCDVPLVESPSPKKEGDSTGIFVLIGIFLVLYVVYKAGSRNVTIKGG